MTENPAPGVTKTYSPQVLDEIARRYPGETIPASVADAVEKLVNEREAADVEEEPEPEHDEYDPGDAVDDQGGMSEVDPRWDEVERAEAEYFGEMEA